MGTLDIKPKIYLYIMNGMVQPAGECVSSPLAKRIIVSMPPIQGHDQRLSAPS
jgi:hypothetical protein